MPRLNLFSVVVFVSLVCLLACNASAFKFTISPNTQRCFTEEVPSTTELSMEYESADAYGQLLDVSLKRGNTEIVWENLGKREGKFETRVADGEEFEICFSSRSVVKGSKTQDRVVTFTWKVGSENINYKDLATKEKLKPIELQLRILEDKIRSIHTEYVYYKEREAEMRSTNEHMTAKVMWVTIILIVIFVLFSYWQMRHLKKYFRKKRMID